MSSSPGSFPVRIVALIGLLTALATPGPVTAANVTELEEVVVTGSSIRGRVAAGISLQTIDSEEIEASGRATLGDFLRELPANFAGGVALGDNVQGQQEGSSAGGNLSGGQGVNLRALGALSTLVLVDGQRVAASGQMGDFVDLAAIPAAAIERIDVLADGASAVYGSDAVGGVVNVILKRSAPGWRTAVRIGSTTSGGGGNMVVAQTYGTSWNSGNLFAGYEFLGQQSIAAAERGLFNGGDFSDRGSVNWRRFAGRAGSAANIFNGTPGGSGTVTFTVPAGPGTGLTVARLQPVSGGVGNTYDLWDSVDILPQTARHALFLNLGQTFGDLELRADARYSVRNSDYQQGFATLYGTLPSTNPFFIPGSTNAFGVRIDDEVLERATRAESLAVRTALSLPLGGGWQGDVSASYSREMQRRRSTLPRDANIYDRVTMGTLQVQAPTSIACALMGLTPASVGALPGGGQPAQRYCAALNYSPFNPYSTEAVSADVFNELIGYERLAYTSWLGQGTLKVEGPIFELPGGAARLAVGLDARRELISGDLDFNYRSIARTEVPYGATARNVLAGFAEVSAPLVGEANARPLLQGLELSAAVRHERGRRSGNFETTDPRLGLRYLPFQQLALRGSWGTSYHAPPIRYTYTGPQPTPGGNGAFVRSNLYLAPCSTTRVRLNGVVGTPGGAGNCSFTAIVVTGAAGSGLRPEKAETWTVGADWAPQWAPTLNLSAGFFAIRVDDRIARIQGGTLPGILSQYFATGTSPYIASLNFAPTQAEAAALFADPRFVGQTGENGTPAQTPQTVAAIINATQANLASLAVRGIDLRASYPFAVGSAGDMEVFFDGTRLTKYAVQAIAGQTYLDQLGYYSSAGNPVKFRSAQGLRWTFASATASATVRHVGGYRCAAGCFVPNATTGAPVATTTRLPIKSWTTLDLEVGRQFAAGSRMSLVVVNAMDRAPPFVNGGTATNDAVPDPYDPANATVTGRAFALTLAKSW